MTTTKPWESDNCKAVAATYMVFKPVEAAALWCGVPSDMVKEELEAAELTEAQGVFRHPLIPCLEPRCRAILDAINNRKLPFSREDGKVVPEGEHVAPQRRRVSGANLRAWIEATFPTDRPSFLFDASEQISASPVSTDTYLVLKAEKEALEARLAAAKKVFRELRLERDALELDRDALKAQLEQQGSPGERAETTYLNIIGGLLSVMLSKSPGGQDGSAYRTQSAVMDALLANFPNKPGLAKSTLDAKFAAAKRSLGAS